MEPECSLLCSQKPGTRPYPESDESSPFSFNILILFSYLLLDLSNGFFKGRRVHVNRVSPANIMKKIKSPVLLSWFSFC
jgi:hypothetical protein